MLLFLLVLLVLVPSSMGQNCSERCCYWYRTVPSNNSDCHVSHNGTAYLMCNVYAPRDNNNNSVKWYRSVESIVEDISNKYEVSEMFFPVAFNSSGTQIDGLFEDRYKLIIRNINSSDSGVYWCQLSADGFCFIPSAYVNITVNTSFTENGCSSVESLVCAVDNSSSCQVIPTPSLPTMSPSPSNKTMSSTVTSVVSSPTYKVTPTQLILCHGEPEFQNLGFVACLGVTVPAAGFTLILMVILICCAGICICWRKKTRIKVVQSVAQNETEHTSDRSNAQVVCLKKRIVHQYEDVEIPQPDEHAAEEPVISDRERALIVSDKMHEYSELEHQAETSALQKTDLGGDQGEPHMYEMVSVVSQDKDKTTVNTKKQLQIEASQYEDICDNKLSKQPKNSFDSFSTSRSSQNQYNVLDHSLVSSAGQKATIKAVTSEDSVEDHHYSKTHAHNLTLMGDSVEEATQDNQYENVGSTVVKSAQRQNTLGNESFDSCEYHVLEEAVSNGTTIPTTLNQPQLTPAPITKRKPDISVLACNVLDYNNSSQQESEIQEQIFDQSRIEESKERVFDDPQYGTLPIAEDKAEHRREAAPIEAFPFDELTDVHEVWIHTD